MFVMLRVNRVLPAPKVLQMPNTNKPPSGIGLGSLRFPVTNLAEVKESRDSQEISGISTRADGKSVLWVTWGKAGKRQDCQGHSDDPGELVLCSSHMVSFPSD
jgi:hypothetical protein